MQGNESITRGSWEAGVTVGCAQEKRWTDAIKEFLVSKLHDLNIKAFYGGRKALKG